MNCVWRQAKWPGQCVAIDRDGFFAMGNDRDDAVRAKSGKRARFQDHAGPDFSVPKIIEPTKRRLAEHFGSEIDSHFGIVMDRAATLHPVDRPDD